MRIRDLFEAKSTAVICVDVQPEYSGINDGSENPVFPEIINFVVNQTGPVLMFVNAEDQGLTGDTIAGIKQYWNDTVCPEEERYVYDEEYNDYIENPSCAKINWNRFTIVDKGYGYFRSWMDHGIDPGIIIKTIRMLYQQKVNDTRDLEFSENPEGIEAIVKQAVEEMNNDPLTVNWTSVAQLRKFSGAYMVGGGRNECLREVQLLMNAFNIRYKRIDHLVYG